MRTVMTAPNQKIIKNNVFPVKPDKDYMLITKDVFERGCRELKPTTFLVWQALHMQYFSATDYLALSTAVITENMGLKRPQTVSDAIKELIKKGWLVNIKGNAYILTDGKSDNEKCCINVLPTECVDQDNINRCMNQQISLEKTTESVGEIRLKEEEKNIEEDIYEFFSDEKHYTETKGNNNASVCANATTERRNLDELYASADKWNTKLVPYGEYETCPQPGEDETCELLPW